MSLPSRLLQIAYSQWGDEYSNSEINTLETGLSLNSTSKCNSSEASGLEDGFTDTEYPAAGFVHTLPGTDVSEIRSLHTGSEYTKECQSMFGLRDVIGNVSEFTNDSFSGRSDFQFSAFPGYSLDGSVGPAPDIDSEDTFWGEDIDGNGSVDDFNEHFDDWIIDTEPFQAKRMNIALGLPIVNTHGDTTFTFEIGPTNGITSEALHDDAWIFNTAAHINASPPLDAAIISGGSYENGSSAGTWFMELVEQSAGSRVDIGFRCVMPIVEKNYLETQTGTRLGNHE